MLGNMANLMKQVGDMKKKMKVVEEDLKRTVIQGKSPANDVLIEVTGKMNLKSVNIAQTLIAKGDKAAVDKAVFFALDDCLKKVSKIAADKLSGVTGGLNIPGLS